MIGKAEVMPDENEDERVIIGEVDGLIIERLANGKIAVYRSDFSNFKRLSRD